MVSKPEISLPQDSAVSTSQKLKNTGDESTNSLEGEHPVSTSISLDDNDTQVNLINETTVSNLKTQSSVEYVTHFDVLPMRELTIKELTELSFKCHMCTQDLSLPNFIQHQFSEHGVLFCVYCSKKFLLGYNLLEHLLKTHRIHLQVYQSFEQYLKETGFSSKALCVECDTLLGTSELETHSSSCRGVFKDVVSQSRRRSAVINCKFCCKSIERGCLTKHEFYCSYKIPPPPSSSSLRPLNYISAVAGIKRVEGGKIEMEAEEEDIPHPHILSPPLTMSGEEVSDGGSSSDIELLEEKQKGHSVDLTHLNFSKSITVTPLDTQNCSSELDESIGDEEKECSVSPVRKVLKRPGNEVKVPDISPVKKRISTSSTVCIQQLSPEPQIVHQLKLSSPLPISKLNHPINPKPIKLKDLQEYLKRADEKSKAALSEPLNTKENVADEVEIIKEVRAPIIVKEPTREEILLKCEDVRERERLLKDMLIEKLIQIKNERHAKSERNFPTYTVQIKGSLSELTPNMLLTQMIKESNRECSHCRAAMILSTDMRPLAQHLFKVHDWEFMPYFKCKKTDDEEKEEKMDEGLEFSLSLVGPEGQDQSIFETLEPFPVRQIVNKVFDVEDKVFRYEERAGFRLRPCDCWICGENITEQSGLFAHWKKYHKGMQMTCPLCSGQFLFAGSMFSHICSGSVENEREGSTNSEPSVELLRLGIKEADESSKVLNTSFLPYHCDACKPGSGGLIFPSFFNYMVHLRRDHTSCELCLEMLEDQLRLERHVKNHKMNYFCWKCSVTYVTSKAYHEHILWKHSRSSFYLECYKCLQKKFGHSYHFCIPPQLFTCSICEISFVKAQSLRVHMRLHPESCGQKPKMHRCPECESEFISKRLLIKHALSEHKETLGKDPAYQLENSNPPKLDSFSRKDTSPIRDHETTSSDTVDMPKKSHNVTDEEKASAVDDEELDSKLATGPKLSESEDSDDEPGGTITPHSTKAKSVNSSESSDEESISKTSLTNQNECPSIGHNIDSSNLINDNDGSRKDKDIPQVSAKYPSQENEKLKDEQGTIIQLEKSQQYIEAALVEKVERVEKKEEANKIDEKIELKEEQCDNLDDKITEEEERKLILDQILGEHSYMRPASLRSFYSPTYSSRQDSKESLNLEETKILSETEDDSDASSVTSSCSSCKAGSEHGKKRHKKRSKRGRKHKNAKKSKKKKGKSKEDDFMTKSMRAEESEKEKKLKRIFGDIQKAYIPEEDLVTEGEPSDEEEYIYNQLHTPLAPDMGSDVSLQKLFIPNEKFLLRQVLSVDSIESLREVEELKKVPALVTQPDNKISTPDPESNDRITLKISKSQSGAITSSGEKLTKPLSTKSRIKITPRRKFGKGKPVKEGIVSKTEAPPPPTEPVRRVYCFCRGNYDEVSEMIGCDADDCEYEWFHFECVGILTAPEGNWYCSDCLEKRKKNRRQEYGRKSDILF